MSAPYLKIFFASFINSSRVTHSVCIVFKIDFSFIIISFLLKYLSLNFVFSTSMRIKSSWRGVFNFSYKKTKPSGFKDSAIYCICSFLLFPYIWKVQHSQIISKPLWKCRLYGFFLRKSGSISTQQPQWKNEFPWVSKRSNSFLFPVFGESVKVMIFPFVNSDNTRSLVQSAELIHHIVRGLSLFLASSLRANFILTPIWNTWNCMFKKSSYILFEKYIMLCKIGMHTDRVFLDFWIFNWYLSSSLRNWLKCRKHFCKPRRIFYLLYKIFTILIFQKCFISTKFVHKNYNNYLYIHL